MILVKDGIERRIEGEEIIKIFKEAGWKEYDNSFAILKEINKSKEEIVKPELEEQPIKKTTKKTTKKNK